MKTDIRKKSILFFLILSLLLVGCNKNYEDDDVKYLKGAALQKMQDHISKKDEIVVIDIRSYEEYMDGHVHHAINIPAPELESRIGYIEDFKDDMVILYGWDADEAEKAGNILFKNGFTNISNADGLREYDYPLHYQENVIASDLLEKIGKKDAYIIDARPESAYKEGHIKGAINVPVNDYENTKHRLPKDKNADISVYCFKGNNSMALSKKLMEDGYTNVYNQLYGILEYDYDLVK